MRSPRTLFSAAAVFLVTAAHVAAQTAAIPPPVVVETGTVASQVLTWVVTVFGGVLSTVATALLVKLLQKAGVETTEAQRAKLQDMIINGLNLGAAKAQQDLAGQAPIEIKNAAVASTIEYIKVHGADTLKALGVDPSSAAFQDAIKARIETAIADDNTPTHPALDPQVSALAGASVVDVKPAPPATQPQ